MDFSATINTRAQVGSVFSCLIEEMKDPVIQSRGREFVSCIKNFNSRDLEVIKLLIGSKIFCGTQAKSIDFIKNNFICHINGQHGSLQPSTGPEDPAAHVQINTNHIFSHTFN